MKNPGAALRQAAVAAGALALAACSRSKEIAIVEAAAPGSATASASAVAPAPAAVSAAASAVAPAPAAASASAFPDASVSACRVVLGPKELPVRSPAVLVQRGDSIEAILNDDGRPRVVAIPAGPVPSTAALAEPAEAGASPGLSIACAVAGDRIFCPDRGGNVHRTARTGGEDRLAASARTGSRISAALLAGTHPALAYLASRQTSEGWVSEAWIAVDDDPPIRISEDGSGATAVTLAARGAALVALSVDARAALTAMHARTVTYQAGTRLGEDAVLFVGGPGDRRTAAALAVGPSGPGLGLLPIAKDVGDFGLALVRVDDPPRVDEPVSWSMYPNGLDPAPVAAVSAATPSRTWVARVRPRVADPASDRVLEIGEATPEGAFVVRHAVAGTSGAPRDVALVVDVRGTLWVAWLDSAGSWVERIACR